MWYIDIICNKIWVSENIVPLDNIASSGVINISSDEKDEYPAEMIIYAKDNELLCIRIILALPFDKELADKITNYNVTYWHSTIENSMRLTGNSLFNIYTIIPTNIVISYGEGSKESLPLSISAFGKPPEIPINYPVLTHFMNAFPRERTLYMQYLNRFTNSMIPLEMRWLNGYKMLELYFKHKKGLQYNLDWRLFVEEWKSDLTPLLLSSTQTLYGFMESVRNDAAHAVNELTYKQDLIATTFPILQTMIMKFLNILKKGKDIEFHYKS